MENPKCPDCGCEQYETSNGGHMYCADCQYDLGEDPNWEPPDVDGEDFRGGEAAAFYAEQQEKARRLK